MNIPDTTGHQMTICFHLMGCLHGPANV